MIDKLKEFSGWNDIPKQRQYEMKTQICAYLFGFVTALFIVALLKGALL